MSNIPTVMTIAPRGMSWHGDTLRSDTFGDPVRKPSLWVDGAPTEGVEVAWLRLSGEDGNGDETQWVVLAVLDREGGWSESGDWKGESYKDKVNGLITHWMPFSVPSVLL